MKVKICGITTLEDALFAADCGADALGFVLYPPSKRFVPPHVVAEIVRSLPPFVLSVGVFAQESAQEVCALAAQAGVQLLQLHNEALFDFPYPSRTLKVARIASRRDVSALGSGDFVLCDTFCEGFGGAGLRMPLAFFDGIDCSRLILAGGLSPDNIGEIRGMGFYGVDVSSGVESSAGKKDPKKVQDFIKNAKTL
ncbi:MAG: phosphoribosylanthranilate isomerase [Helicobacter sp.]|nr:phosphoribosylanthranilate isomerase [Helicobacter sp.]MDE7196202.1 phosphoribosylanthranilate isomerase [Helicobacter sp.]